MKKNKILYSIILVIALFSITACGNKSTTKKIDMEPILLNDSKYGSISFEYNKNEDYTTTNKIIDDKTTLEIVNNSDNYILKINFYETTLDNYKYIYSKRYNDECFYEYKWGNYNGFISGCSNSTIKFKILLTKDENAIALNGVYTKINADDKNILDMFKGDNTQYLLHTLKYNNN